MSLLRKLYSGKLLINRLICVSRESRVSRLFTRIPVCRTRSRASILSVSRCVQNVLLSSDTVRVHKQLSFAVYSAASSKTLNGNDCVA